MGIPEESVQRLMVLRQEIDRIFRDFFDPHRPEVIRDGGQLDFVMDVLENEEEIVIEAELPGVSRDSIELSVLRDIIIIEGNKGRQAEPMGDKQHQCMERRFGHFRRIVEIPGAGDTRHIKAEFDRGILRINLPKIQDRRGQRRRVEIG